MTRLYGKLNKEIVPIYYDGESTTTANVDIDNKEKKIYVNVKQVPNDLTIFDVATNFTYKFNGSMPCSITLSDYTIVKNEEVPEGYRASYSLTKDNNVIGEPILIPKDNYIVKVTYKVCEENNVPLEGLKIGDPYLEFLLSDNTYLYTPLENLVDTFIAGKGIIISQETQEGNRKFTISAEVTLEDFNNAINEINTSIENINKQITENINTTLQEHTTSINNLNTNLTNEINRATNAEENLNTLITNEAEARQAEDTKLRTSIESANTAITNLSDTLTEEQETRQQQDEELGNKINELSENLNNEISDRQDAINSLDYSDTTIEHNFITSVSQTDGLISVTRSQPNVEDIEGLSTQLEDLQSNITSIDNNKVDKQAGYSLMSEAEHTKLSGIEEGAQVNTILGVKGGAEESYRQGNVNITKANIGLSKVEDKSSQDILNEINSNTITHALGYTPYNSTNPNNYTSNLGTVTSVGLQMPTGFSIDNSTITESGTIVVSYADGYSLPTTTQQTTWTNKQDKLTAGAGIVITDNVISADIDFNVKVVDQLPPTGEKHTFYLIEDVDNTGSYILYVYSNDTWYKIGDLPNLHLSDYYTKTAVDGLLDKKLNITDAQDTYATKTNLSSTETKLSGLITAETEARTQAVQTLNESISTINNTLENKVDVEDGKGLSSNDFTDDYISDINANTSARHTHANKALLDSYTNTNENITTAVADAHTHTNKSVLDGITHLSNATITLKANNVSVGNFTLNQEANKELNFTIPTKVSELENDTGFITTGDFYTKAESDGRFVSLTEAQTINGIKTFNGTTTIQNLNVTTNTNLKGEIYCNDRKIYDVYSLANDNGQLMVSGVVDEVSFQNKGGTIAYLDDVPTNYVTTDTQQEISGAKTFNNGVTVLGTFKFNGDFANSNSGVIQNVNKITNTTGSLYLSDLSGDIHLPSGSGTLAFEPVALTETEITSIWNDA